MKNKIKELIKTKGIYSILPMLLYFTLLVPTITIYFFTWLLSPIQPDNFSDLEYMP